MKKGIEIDRMNEIEIKLEKLKMPKSIINTIKKVIISKKYLCHILRHKNIVLNRRFKANNIISF